VHNNDMLHNENKMSEIKQKKIKRKYKKYRRPEQGVNVSSLEMSSDNS